MAAESARNQPFSAMPLGQKGGNFWLRVEGSRYPHAKKILG
jgi:hypothetical protein